MRVAIHQPNYFPWIGYFLKMAMCDVFVFHDIVEYTKSGVTRRVKIADINHSPQSQWLSIPLIKHSDFSKIKDLEIVSGEWTNLHFGKLVTTYKKAPFFQESIHIVDSIFNKAKDAHKLADINRLIIESIAKEIGIINKEFIFSSELADVENFINQDLNIAIVEKLRGTHYVSGKGALNYQEEEVYKAKNIELIYIDSMSIINDYNYHQFVPTQNYGVSIIDVLMNIGVENTKGFLNSFYSSSTIQNLLL